MAYEPENNNYKKNTNQCLPSRGYWHNWDETGHPLTHQCNFCHKPKWVKVRDY